MAVSVLRKLALEATQHVTAKAINAATRLRAKLAPARLSPPAPTDMVRAGNRLSESSTAEPSGPITDVADPAPNQNTKMVGIITNRYTPSTARSRAVNLPRKYCQRLIPRLNTESATTPSSDEIVPPVSRITKVTQTS